MENGFVEYDPAPASGPHQIVGPSSNRSAITFIPPGTGRVTLANQPVSADGNGIVLEAGGKPLRISMDEYGLTPTYAWYAFYVAGSTAVSWIQSVG